MDRKKQKKHPGMFLLLRTLKHILLKDDEYIHRSLTLGDSPNYDYLEIKHNGTEERGKIIYVIKELSDREGFCATIRIIIGYLLYAEQSGFIPKINLTKEFLYFDEEKSKEFSNPWEYYFDPAEKVYDETKALNVCYARPYHMMAVKEYSGLDAYLEENYYNEEVFHICTPIIKKYLRLKPDIINESYAFLSENRDKGEKILGVHFRGTDFKQGYNGHPVHVSEEQMISEVKKAIIYEKFSTVFLATDDASFSNKLKDSIGETELLQYLDVYRSDGDQSVAFSKNDRKYHHYLLGYEIVRDMYTLSLCDGLVAGKSSVGFLSNLYKHSRNEGYEYMRIVDNGNHENKKEICR